MVIALIPARAGSTRVPGKNTRILNGHPLIAYAIAGALHAKSFHAVYVTTNDPEARRIASDYGAGVINRPDVFCMQYSPDIQFVEHAIQTLNLIDEDTIVILRPTNPFRTAETIRRALRHWANNQPADSMRAVSLPDRHIYKQWQPDGIFIRPVSDKRIDGHRVCDVATQSLPEFYGQDGCLHIVPIRTVIKFGNYTGEDVLPFYTDKYESLDINKELDWIIAEVLIERGIVQTEPIT